MNVPTLIRCPLRNQPRPFPVGPPPATALTSGVMMLSVKALIKVLNARATTRPTAIMIKSPCIRKFLKPRSITGPSHSSLGTIQPGGPAARDAPTPDPSARCWLRQPSSHPMFVGTPIHEELDDLATQSLGCPRPANVRRWRSRPFG